MIQSYKRTFYSLALAVCPHQKKKYIPSLPKSARSPTHPTKSPDRNRAARSRRRSIRMKPQSTMTKPNGLSARGSFSCYCSRTRASGQKVRSGKREFLPQKPWFGNCSNLYSPATPRRKSPSHSGESGRNLHKTISHFTLHINYVILARYGLIFCPEAGIIKV